MAAAEVQKWSDLVVEIVVIKQGRLSTATDNDSTGGSSLTGGGKQSGPEREE